jgi:hypothetical protein
MIQIENCLGNPGSFHSTKLEQHWLAACPGEHCARHTAPSVRHRDQSVPSGWAQLGFRWGRVRQPKCFALIRAIYCLHLFMLWPFVLTENIPQYLKVGNSWWIPFWDFCPSHFWVPGVAGNTVLI